MSIACYVQKSSYSVCSNIVRSIILGTAFALWNNSLLSVLNLRQSLIYMLDAIPVFIAALVSLQLATEYKNEVTKTVEGPGNNL